MRYTHILFDLDGTLTDPKPRIFNCIRHALVKMGREAGESDSWERYIGPPLLDSFAELLQTRDMTQAQQALEIYRERFSRSGLFENRVYAGVPPLLAELTRQGGTLYVATSKPRVFARRIIDHFQLNPYFSKVYGSELDGTRVEKADLISHILAMEKLPRQQTVMIGDRKYDVTGAKAAGLPAAGVLWGYGSRQELDAAGADWLCSAPAGLLNICVHGGCSSSTSTH